MMCPNCDNMKTYIVDAVDKPDHTSLRRRKCPVCGYKFSTTERLVQAGILLRRKREDERDSAI